MYLINTPKPNSDSVPKDTFKVILDEPRLYLRESLGSVMVRGEVIVNFSKDTYIQGPIDLLFEGIQRFYPWQEIMTGYALGSTIETKLQVVELSLLPPNSQGLMPAGVQRFPFEFPIPTSLPTSVYIKDRIEIFYQVHATLHRSVSNLDNSQSAKDNKNFRSLVNWARYNTQKNLHTATSPLRIVRAMESVTTNSLSTDNTRQENMPILGATSSIDRATSNSLLPWNRRDLCQYQSNLDEQHDLFAISLAGRSLANLTQPIQCLHPYEGVRFKIGIDRTAIALGTNIGVEVMIQPTYKDVIVKSVLLKITETRKYSMKVPAGHTWGVKNPMTKRYTEPQKMVLKWAYGHSKEDQDNIKRLIRRCKSNNQYMDPSYDDSFHRKLECPKIMEPSDTTGGDNDNEFSASRNAHSGPNFINLKELNQRVCLGEYFDGRFIMPVPDCSNVLHPSMEHESIKIKHWIQLLVTVECGGRTFDLNMETSGQVLDCRLVNTDDDHQTLIPPPPAYEPHDSYEKIWKPSTFWEQRQPITLVSGWGSCVPCPCEAKKLKASKKKSNGATLDNIHSNTPEWGPPPSYSTS